jgi:P-loop Domain of unknown function (DUF2791)
MEPLDQRTARQIIHSLGESGQPPKLGARRLNAGTGPLLEKLRADYLTDHCVSIDGMDGGGTCKWVEANYGNGKTQFLRCVQEMAWELDYVTAFVELSHDECPLDRTDRVYGAIARALQAKPLSLADVDRAKGVDVVLSQLLDRMFAGVLTGLPNDPLKLQALEWIQGTLKNTPVESTAFVTAAAELLLAKLQGNEEKSRLLAIYLRGEQPPAADLKKIGVYEQLNNSNGFRLLRSLCQLLQRSGLAAGTVLLFDEARRVLSLMSSKSQKVACENLQSVINRCNLGELPGTMFLYGVMPEFFTNFAALYPALQTRCGPATRVKLELLANIKEPDLLTLIGQHITDIFRVAHPEFPEQVGFLDEDLKLTVNEALRQLGGTGTRRLLVKGWVQVLNSVRDGRTGGLTRNSAEKLLAGASEELQGIESSMVEAEGE